MRGRGGCGLVLTEICSVMDGARRGDARNLLIDSDEKIPSFRAMVDAVHQTGAKFGLEIHYPGCQGVPALIPDGTCVSPSGQESKLTHASTRALAHDEVLEVIDTFVQGIRQGTSPDFAIMVRITADEYLRMIGIDDGITLPLAVEYGRMFQEWGADAIDVSAGNYETMNWAWEPVSFDEGWKSVNGYTREPSRISHMLRPGGTHILIRSPLPA